MQEFPHHYTIQASAEAEGTVSLKGESLPQLVSAPPAEFGGPGDQWSPEHLLVAAVGDCFVLTFRAIAAASKLEWRSLEVAVDGKLDRVERVMKFTHFKVTASLKLAEGGDTDRAERLLQRAEAGCLITNSLEASVELEADVQV
ncbi:MAG: OsmC family protein [Pseudomonadota bacterium]